MSRAVCFPDLLMQTRIIIVLMLLSIILTISKLRIKTGVRGRLTSRVFSPRIFKRKYLNDLCFQRNRGSIQTRKTRDSEKVYWIEALYYSSRQKGITAYTTACRNIAVPMSYRDLHVCLYHASVLLQLNNMVPEKNYSAKGRGIENWCLVRSSLFIYIKIFAVRYDSAYCWKISVICFENTQIRHFARLSPLPYLV